MVQVVELLPSKQETLSSHSSMNIERKHCKPPFINISFKLKKINLNIFF
jgi:hypothetical protein